MSKAPLPSRYPGAQPFETHQRHIFFGREKDIESLCRKVRQEPLTALYSKSGLGKSSLLNAGVVPVIEEGGEYRTLRIRFNAFDKDAPVAVQLMPDVRCRKIIKGYEGNVATFLDKLIPNEPTIWHDLKEQQLLALQANEQEQPAPTKLLLLFDQFEELFTYPPEAVLAFRKQLAEALYTPLPSRYWDVLELYGKDDCPLDEAQQVLLQRPLELRVVMAIRQDRMHLFGQLSDYLPTASKAWYELRPLNRQQARSAIIAPAALPGKFVSPPFRYEEAAIETILNFLTDDGTEPIESTQLQIVCNSIEMKVAAQSLPVIGPADVGDLEAIIENYYLEKIGSIGNEAEQLAARRLVEDGLVYEEEERRLSLYEGLILKTYGISSDTLRKLVDSHLLRAEPSLQGGYTYELSHDTLVAPVLKAKAKRKEGERAEAEREAAQRQAAELEALRQKAEAERHKAEEERRLREQAEQATVEAETQRSFAQKNEVRAKKITRITVGAFIIALGFALLAWEWKLRAGEAITKADKNAKQATIQAENAQKALELLKLEQASTEEQRKLAEAKTKEAEASAAEAKKQEALAKQSLKEMKAAQEKELEANISQYITAAHRMYEIGDEEMAKRTLDEAAKLAKGYPTLLNMINKARLK